MTAEAVVNDRELARLVREHRKRVGLSLRAAAEVSGCPLNTLCRVEKGHLPDLSNFARLSRWAGFDPDVILGRTRVAQGGTLDEVRAVLHQDPALDESSAEQIAGVLDSLYANLARPVRAATHVHAAATMTPTAARMSADIVSGLERALADGDRS